MSRPSSASRGWKSRRLFLVLALLIGSASLLSLSLANKAARAVAETHALALVQATFTETSASQLMLYADETLFELRPELDWPEHIGSLRRRLGALRRIESISGVVESDSADFSIVAEFSSGPAEISLRLLKDRRDWLVGALHVSSGALSG